MKTNKTDIKKNPSYHVFQENNKNISKEKKKESQKKINIKK